MEPRIAPTTLGVRDLERAIAFYGDGLGLSPPRGGMPRRRVKRRSSATELPLADLAS